MSVRTPEAKEDKPVTALPASTPPSSVRRALPLGYPHPAGCPAGMHADSGSPSYISRSENPVALTKNGGKYTVMED